MYSVYLKLTNRCNLKCKHCYIWKKKKWQGDITEEVVEALIRQFPNGEHSKIILFGGEPTLYPPDKAKRLLEILKKGGWNEINIQTNLVSVNQEWVEIFKVYTKGHIGTSLDTSRIELGVVDKILANVKRLKKEGIDVSAVITVTRDLTINLFRELVNSFIKAGGYSFKVLPVNPNGREGKVEIEHYLDILKVSLEIHKKFNNFENLLYLKRVFTEGVKGYYLGGNCAKYVRTVDPNGDVYVCPDLSGDKQYCVGNLLDGSYEKNKTRVLSVWGYRVFYEREMFLGRSEGGCKGKDCFLYCSGGCTASSITVNGNYLTKDPYCEAHRFLLEVIKNGT